MSKDFRILGSTLGSLIRGSPLMGGCQNSVPFFGFHNPPAIQYATFGPKVGTGKNIFGPLVGVDAPPPLREDRAVWILGNLAACGTRP